LAVRAREIAVASLHAFGDFFTIAFFSLRGES
jgi:hypothetical protein